MKRSFIISILMVFFTLFGIEFIHATKFLKLSVVDKDYLMVHFRDGEVRYRDDGTGPSAFLGHTFVEGDDTLKVLAIDWIHPLHLWRTIGQSVPMTMYLTEHKRHWLPTENQSQ